jgi:hypothetical protein
MFSTCQLGKSILLARLLLIYVTQVLNVVTDHKTENAPHRRSNTLTENVRNSEQKKKRKENNPHYGCDIPGPSNPVHGEGTKSSLTGI